MNDFETKLNGTLYGLMQWSDWDRLESSLQRSNIRQVLFYERILRRAGLAAFNPAGKQANHGLRGRLGRTDESMLDARDQYQFRG